MEVFKDAYVKFQAERVGNAYISRNLDITVGGLQLSSVSRSKVMEKSKITMISCSNVQFYPEDRLGLGGGAQQESPDHYSFVGANSHICCVD